MSELDDLLDPNIKGSGESNNNEKELPNATAVLALGIISIVGCFMYGVPGLICGIIALSLHKKDKEMYSMSPATYETSFKNSKAGYICAVIGTSLSGAVIALLIFVIMLNVL